MPKQTEFAAIILAAGLGKRMRSQVPKVLHRIGQKPMIKLSVETLIKIHTRKIITVVNPKNNRQVRKILKSKTDFAVQVKQLGTADATKAGLAKVPENIKSVAVMYGDDTAFYKGETILKVFKKHIKSGALITFVTLTRDNPQGLGRIVRRNGRLRAIVEENDASQKEKMVKEVNDGLYFFHKDWLLENLPKISSSPVSGEFYLTDLIKIALKENKKVETYKLEDKNQWHGINTQEELEEANRKIKIKPRVHFMGISGAGASSVAGLAQKNGFKITGCDIEPNSPYAKSLKLKVAKGHNQTHLLDIDMLVFSPAILKFNPKNPEVKKAKDLKIPVLSWQKFLGKYLQSNKFVIAVAGAYGKSTTTAMISKILIDSKLDPTCQIGARVIEWGQNFRFGKSHYFVCEADEYNDNFLNYNPDIAVILNIAWEHPDFFKSKRAVLSSYTRFIRKVKENGTLIISPDPDLEMIARNVRPDIQIIPVVNFGQMNLSIIGDFRKENANFALMVAKVLNLDLEKAKKSTEGFKGLGRRLEFKGKIKNTKIYDDYAVQPYTIKVTADALKQKFKNKRILLVFEPHTFSRINTFFSDFVKSLKHSNVDKIFITEVFAAREHGNKTQVASKLAKAVGNKAQFTGTLIKTADFVKKNLGTFDVILSMGAGDIYKLYDLLRKS